MKPLLLSLIHVTQDNWHRSRGATVGDTEKEARSWGWDGWVGGREVGCGHTSASVQSESAHLNDDVKDYCPQCVKHSQTDQTAKDFFFYLSLCQCNSFIFTLFFSKCWLGLKQKLPKSTCIGKKQKQGCSSQFQNENSDIQNKLLWA